MDRSDVMLLLKEHYEIDELGQRIPRTTARMVYCSITSVTGTEWAAAGQNGIKPEYRVIMFRHDYCGEETVNIGGCVDGCAVIGGTNYTVYRTYFRDTDEMELYLEKRAGS